MRQQLPLALLLATSTFACVDNTPSGSEPTEAEVLSALEQENGGLDFDDELPMFDEQLAFDTAAIEPSTPVADTMATDERVQTLERQVDGARIRLAIAWGRMPPDREAETGRNWSGSLTLSRGAMVVGRTIGFEETTDRLLPRTAPETVAFESVTRPFADGLILRILDPDPTAGPLTLTYTSADAAHTFTLDLGQLAAGPVARDAGDGNRVVAAALRDRDDCDHGFMRGRWISLRENVGVFRGVVGDETGDPVGHIRGIWGQRRNGEPVMFGKYIANDGTARGIFAGTYRDGHYQGRWLVSTGDHGRLGGVYFDAPNRPGGFFAGRWAETSCAQ